MRRTLIALRGTTHSGKSSTLREVYRRLLEEAGEVRGAGNRGENVRDIRGGILVIQGVLVGFLSIAEPPLELEDRLACLADQGCVVVVCACRSDGATVAAVERMRERGFEIRRIAKERVVGEAEQERCNQAQATQVVAAVRLAV